MRQAVSPYHDAHASPTCPSFLECVAVRRHGQRHAYGRAQVVSPTGIEREMLWLYKQPHLVEPMKLTVYDQLPTSPLPTPRSTLSQWVVQGRNLASRASSHTGVSLKQKTSLKPRPNDDHTPATTSDLPFRRRREMSPLQLSIYMPDNRLSDLPEFDRLSFTDGGDICFPPRALLRPQSEGIIGNQSYDSLPRASRGLASMYEYDFKRAQAQRNTDTVDSRPDSSSHVRKETASSIVSTSRPPSEYDALNSHPVSWYSLPGLPPQMQFASDPNKCITVLSPMREEFSPPASAVIINGAVLAFPDTKARRSSMLEPLVPASVSIPAPMPTATSSHRSSMKRLRLSRGRQQSQEGPSPVLELGPQREMAVVHHASHPSHSVSVRSGTTRSTPTKPAPMLQETEASEQELRLYFHKNFQTNTRINQWLSDRSRTSSVSTVRTSITSSSFSEHRRKRSQFYQLNRNRADVSKATTEPPAPLNFSPLTSLSVDAQHTPNSHTIVFVPEDESQAGDIDSSMGPRTPSYPHHHSPNHNQAATTDLSVSHSHAIAFFPASYQPTTSHSVHVQSHDQFQDQPQPQPSPPQQVQTRPFQSHSRTTTSSTVPSTVAPDVIFEETYYPSETQPTDAMSMTTVDDIRSRTGTVKSYATATTTRSTSTNTNTSRRPALATFSEGREFEWINTVNEVGQTELGKRSQVEFCKSRSVRGNKRRESTEKPRHLQQWQQQQRRQTHANASYLNTKHHQHQHLQFGKANQQYRMPRPASPVIPSARQQVADVEKYIHDLCSTRGFRRVNIGVAF